MHACAAADTDGAASSWAAIVASSPRAVSCSRLTAASPTKPSPLKHNIQPLSQTITGTCPAVVKNAGTHRVVARYAASPRPRPALRASSTMTIKLEWQHWNSVFFITIMHNHRRLLRPRAALAQLVKSQVKSQVKRQAKSEVKSEVKSHVRETRAAFTRHRRGGKPAARRLRCMRALSRLFNLWTKWFRVQLLRWYWGLGAGTLAALGDMMA